MAEKYRNVLTIQKCFLFSIRLEQNIPSKTVTKGNIQMIAVTTREKK